MQRKDVVMTNSSLSMSYFTETVRKVILRIVVKAKSGVNVNDPQIKNNLLEKVRFMITFFKQSLQQKIVHSKFQTLDEVKCQK